MTTTFDGISSDPTSFPPPSPPLLWLYYEIVLSLRSWSLRPREGNMALRDRYFSSGSEVNLINENEPDAHSEDEPCIDDEEEDIELSLIAPSDDQWVLWSKTLRLN